MWHLQFTSSHLSSSNSSLGASVKSIPDYVYSQLSSPHVTSPEAKKLHQEIYSVSQKGTNPPSLEESVHWWIKWLVLAGGCPHFRNVFFPDHHMHWLVCSPRISQVHSWCFDLGERESEAGLDRPGPEAEHVTATGYPLQHTDRGSPQRKPDSPEAVLLLTLP